MLLLRKSPASLSPKFWGARKYLDLQTCGTPCVKSSRNVCQEGCKVFLESPLLQTHQDLWLQVQTKLEAAYQAIHDMVSKALRFKLCWKVF